MIPAGRALGRVGGVALLLAGVLAASHQQPAAHPTQYTTAQVTRQALVKRINVSATIEWIDPVEIAAPVGGRIDWLLVAPSTRVQAGALLATIVAAELGDDLERADAEVRRTRAHVRQLIETHGARLTAARVAMDRAVAKAASIRRHALRAEIRAPISGSVVRCDVAPGASVGPNGPLFLIARNVLGMRLVADVDEVDAAALKLNAHVTFTVPVWPDREFDGRLVGIHPPGTAVVEGLDPGHALRAGMPASATFDVVRSDTLVVPDAALRSDIGGSQHVLVLEHGRERVVDVVAGASDGVVTEVRGDLVAGQQVASPRLSAAR